MVCVSVCICVSMSACEWCVCVCVCERERGGWGFHTVNSRSQKISRALEITDHNSHFQSIKTMKSHGQS